MFCKKCGKVIDEDSTFCKFCGASLSEGSTAQPVQPMYQQPQPGQPMYQQPQPGQSIYQQPQPGQPMYQQPQPGQPMYQQPQPVQPMYQRSAYHPVYPTGGYYNASSFDARLLWFIGVGISALFAALGLVVDLWNVRVYFVGNTGISMINFWTKWFNMLDMSDSDSSVLVIGVIVAAICFIISLICAIKILVGLSNKSPLRFIADDGKSASTAAVIGEVILFITQIIVNSMISSYDDEGMLHTTFFFWVILVLSLLNIFLFAPNARMAKTSASSSSSSVAGGSTVTGPKSIVEKRCNVCRTVFIIGTSCPKCGSKSFDIEK